MRLNVVEAHAALQKTHSLPGQLLSAEMRVLWRKDYTLTQKHLLTVDIGIMKDIEAQLNANHERLDALIETYEETMKDHNDQALLKPVMAAKKPYRVIQKELLLRNERGVDEEVRQIVAQRLDPAFQRAHDAIQALMDDNQAEAERTVSAILASVQSARNGIIGTFLVAVVAAMFCGYFLMGAITAPMARLIEAVNFIRQGDFTRRLAIEHRDEFGELAAGFNRMVDELTALVGQIQKTGIQVTTSVTEVAATTRQQQATAGEIAATTSEVGATSKEISATSKELVRTMDDVARVAERSATLASSSQVGLSHMEETMRHVMSAASSISAKLGILNDKAGSITQMITTITKVADQTNLLSLNAAIEAEKAGEYGKGFSVVATQIRRLADQTAVATYDIELMVKEIQSAVSASVMGMDKFSEEVRRGMQEVQSVSGQLTQIIDQVQTLAPRFDSVSEGVQAQSVGAEQITEALLQLSEAAQQTVESVHQSSLAIEDLNQIAQTLRGGVSRFKLQD